MNRNHHSIPAGLLCAAAVFLAAAPLVPGQTAPSPAVAPPDEPEVLVLSPFVVTAEEDQGYRAINTLAGTRIRTEMKDVGSAISVVTEEFLRDTGANNNQDLLVYTTNTEVGGLGGNFTGNGTGTGYVNTDTNRLRPQNNTRVRGLTAADNTRDFFLSDIPWDGYIVDRVDLLRGPNSILFGLGSPAGIVNSSLNAAMFRNGNTVEFRFDGEGSFRASADLNRELLDEELALRVAGLSDRTYYQQDPAYNFDRRVYGALRWDPKFLGRGHAHTSLRMNFEYGDINANRPRTTPPVDAITPWFMTGAGNLNRRTFNAQTVNVVPTDPADTQSGVVNTGSPTYLAWMDGPAGRIYDGPVAVFPDPAGVTQSYWFMGERATDTWSPNSGKPQGGNWFVFRGIQPYNVYGVKAQLPGYRYGVYNPVSLSDPSIFDFFHQLIDGPNKKEWQNWKAANLNLAQTFLDRRLGFELVYDEQRYDDGQINIIGQNNGQIITIDVMETYPDGTANPNVGRPMITSDSENNNARQTKRTNYRLTAFGELRATDFLDPESGLARFLGTHNFTGLYSEEEYYQEIKSWMHYAADDRFDARSGKSINEASRAVSMIHYLGPTLRNATTAAGAGLAAISALHVPVNGGVQLWDHNYPGTDTGDRWITSPLTIWNADAGDRTNLYKLGGASKQLDKVESVAAIWQGYLWDRTLVPTVGWRRDTARAYVSGNPPNLGSARADILNPAWRLPLGEEDAAADGFGGRRYNRVTGESLTWSVVAHLPRSFQRKLPWESSLSLFYSKSDNFRPDAARRDILGSPVDPATGETEEYGVLINLLNDKLVMRINHFDTKVKNVTLSYDELPNFYLIGAGESWGYGYATWAKNGLGDFAGTNYNRRTDGSYIVPSLPVLNGQPWLSYQPAVAGSVDSWTAADIQATYDAQMAAVNAFTNPANRPPENFMLNWGMQDYPDSRWWGDDAGHGGPGQNNWAQATGVVVTGDTQSKGWEFEMTYTPRPNLSVALNASKTDAVRSNLAKSYSDWIEARWAFYQTDAGNVRLWGAGAGGETVRSKFQAEVMGNYLLFTQLAAGSQAPEVRPWRFNVVGNYRFTGGRLAGFNIGGAYRWQDRAILGYPLITGATDADTRFDIANPYMSDTDMKVDAWIGYEHKLTEKIHWRIQANVRNLFGENELIPVTVNPGGAPASMRIEEGLSWTVTNTFKF